MTVAKNKIKVLGVIPARMASSRFPGKPIKPILGLPMVEHVRRRAALCNILDEIVVATCDGEIADALQEFGANVVMTADTHDSCVDRVAEAAQKTQSDIIINIQGDIPMFNPKLLEDLVTPLLKNDDLMFVDMMGPINNEEELNDPNVVKVVADPFGNAMYYSREPIPSVKKSSGVNVMRYRQFGINAYRRDSLFMFTKWERTPLEKIESVDMLRVLENGYKVRMVTSLDPVVCVDTLEDLKRAEEIMKSDSLAKDYM